MNRHAKALATKALKASEFAEQVIPIDENWEISRFDELNWQIKYKGKFYGYYGSVRGALEALPAKMLGKEARDSLAGVYGSLRAISERIERAISIASFTK